MFTFSSVKKYVSLVKFSHTIFSMPFALIGYFLGLKHEGAGFDMVLLMVIILAVLLARNTAMGFNRLVDRRFDALNPRTASRELPARILSPMAVSVFIIINALGFVLTSWFINPLCFYLSPVALFVIMGYSLTKRFTPFSHMVLGLGLALAPIGAYLAVTGQFQWIPLMFSFAVLFWVSGFDIIYALQDEFFDKKNALFSIPAALGKDNALMVSRIFHLFSSFFIFWAGWMMNPGYLYWTGTAVFCILLIYQHILVKPKDLSKVNLAFFTTNGIASLVFAAFVIADLLLAKN
ncbi:MAG: UbiA-like polyprenyltransferase [Bacteroidales bacterium]|nr:UbiA-like polyprenyltransferase [Bacteroidales bacterium]